MIGSPTTRLVKTSNQGEIEVPVAKAYPLSQVQQAYEELARRHTLENLY